MRYALVAQGTLAVGTQTSTKTDPSFSIASADQQGNVNLNVAPFDPNNTNIPTNVHTCFWSGGIPSGMTAEQAIGQAQIHNQTQFPANFPAQTGGLLTVGVLSPLPAGSYSYLVIAEFPDAV